MSRRNATVHEPKTEQLSRDQVRRRIDREAKRTLGISGEEFLRRFRSGELEHSPAELRMRFSLSLFVRTAGRAVQLLL